MISLRSGITDEASEISVANSHFQAKVLEFEFGVLYLAGVDDDDRL